MNSIFDEGINRKNTFSLKWDACQERFGREDILPMWVADMDFKSPAEVIEAIKKRADHGVFGYTKVSNQLTEALVHWLEKRQYWSINPRWITHSPGVVTSINVAIHSFTEVGDRILIQTPVYYPFYSCIQDNGRQLVTNSLVKREDSYEMDFFDLENKFRQGVKMMILCSPHNPIGRVWKKAELEGLARLCLKYQVLLVSDEIHSDLVYREYKHFPVASLSEEVASSTITLLSPTKAFNLAGLAYSVAVISNPDLKKQFEKTLHRTGAGMLNIFGLEAAEAAYTYGEEWLSRLLGYLEGNLEFLNQFFMEKVPQIKVIKPEATYLAWLDCNELPLQGDKLKEFFTFKAGVGMNDGITFGKEGFGFQRINFGCPREVLVEGLERIKKAVEQL